MKRKILVIPILAITANAAFATDSCDISVDDIFNKAPTAESRATSLSSKSVNDLAASGVQSLAALATSTLSEGGATAGTLTNFVSLLSASSLGGSLSGDDAVADDENLSFEYNQRLGTSSAGVLKLRASFRRDPGVYEPLVEAVAESDRDGFRSAAEDDLDFGDDVTYSLSYSFGQGGFFGKRSIDSYQRVFTNLMGSVDVSDYQIAQAEFLPLLGDAQAAADRMAEQAGAVAGDSNYRITVDRKISNFPEVPQKSVLCAKAIAFQQASRNLDAAEDLLIEQSKFDRLISNSPQLLFSVALNDKEDLAGPDETTAALTFEWGFRTSIGAMERAARERDGSPCRINCAARYLEYVNQNAEAIEAGDRLKLEVEYVDVDSYSFQALNDSFIFKKPGSEKLVASLGYGRSLSRGFLGNSRVDVELRYEDVDDDPDRNDRTVGTMTFSKRLTKTEGWTVPFTLIYSNRPEYVQMNTDDKLSAHIGIRWDMGAK